MKFYKHVLIIFYEIFYRTILIKSCIDCVCIFCKGLIQLKPFLLFSEQFILNVQYFTYKHE